MRRVRKYLALLLASALAVTISPPGQTAQAARPSAGGISVWTESAYTSVFRDSGPSDEAGQDLVLDTARHDHEGGQIVLRRPEAFTVNSVAFTALTGPAGTITADNLSYNFVDYEYLNHNSIETYPLVRMGQGLYPDRLRNDPSMAVGANSTQSIWVRAYVPATAAAGTYTGSVTIRTTVGDIQVPLTVRARNVLIPPTKDSEFTTVLWHNMLGPASWDHGRGDTGELYFEVKRYDDRWWQLVDNFAQMHKKYRGNSIQLPVIHLLREGGSTVDANGNYQFNWTRFDQVVERIMRAGHIKRLEGFTMSGPHDDPRSPWYDPNRPRGKWLTEVLGRTDPATGRAAFSWVDWDSAPATKWFDQYFPALRDHLRSKGWETLWWQHISDEAGHNGGPTQYFAIDRKIRAHWPEVKIGDALIGDFGLEQAKSNEVVVPILDLYDQYPAAFDAQRAAGKDLWLYNCVGPRANFLNRFVDQPQWHQRMTMWYAYGRKVNGYLHWAYMNWQYPMNDQPTKGDGYIVRPDKDRLTFESSPRYESLRDGIEDWEVLNILGKFNPGLAKDLATSMAQTGDKYAADVSFQQRIRRMALDAAAGLPVIANDHARRKPATGSSAVSGFGPDLAVDGNGATGWRPASTSGTQWLQVDLKQQSRLDGVNLRWSAAHATNYKLKTSYDGTTWVDVHTRSSGDGGDDFIGFAGKARYLRLEVAGGGPYQLNSLEVSGYPLVLQNLAAGKPYQLNPAPDDQPDEGGRQLTDGLTGDAFPDGRSVGWKTFQGSDRYTDMTIDLGSQQRVAEAKVHAYEEYQYYRPDELSVLTSTDGTNFTLRKTVSGERPEGQSKIWYDLAFPAVQARWVRVSFKKRGTAQATVTFMDELEVYGAGSAVGPEELPGSAAFAWKHQNHMFAPSATASLQHWWFSPGIGVERDVWANGPIQGKVAGLAFQNQQHVYGRSATNTLLNWSWTEGQTSIQAADLGGEAASDPAAVVWGNQRHVFARSADGGLTHWEGGQVSSWPKAPVPIVGKPSAFSARDELHVVARGTDNRLYHWWWKAGEPEPQVEAWGGEAHSDPTTFSYDGQIHAFAKAADGQLFHWWADPSDGLHSDKWTGAPAGFKGTPAGYRYGSQQHVVARGADDTLYHWWWDQPTNKINFANWGGQVHSDPAASVYSNQQHIFAQSATNTLSHWQWDATAGLTRDDWGGSIKYP